ncbi:MAG: hypothetical protein ISS66_01485 [Desulfobacteraceae bacterium]|nr:hypothetical protein [Desulfobacteraceae bacterium]
MGEIRSTLDIIMEKTKDLTMSDAEKEEYRRTTLSGKLKGLVQKFIDNQISSHSIRSEIESEREKSPALVDELLKGELIERLEPDGDNDKVFELLEELLDVDTSSLEHPIGEFREKVNKEKIVIMDGLRKKLAEREISGPAAVPNLTHDETWSTFYEESKGACKEQLSVIVDNQTTGSR